MVEFSQNDSKKLQSSFDVRRWRRFCYFVDLKVVKIFVFKCWGYFQFIKFCLTNVAYIFTMIYWNLQKYTFWLIRPSSGIIRDVCLIIIYHVLFSPRSNGNIIVCNLLKVWVLLFWKEPDGKYSKIQKFTLFGTMLSATSIRNGELKAFTRHQSVLN